jgi:hypothetical protein
MCDTAFDYRGGSIVNLMSTLGTGLGAGDGPYPPVRLLDPAEVAEARRVVLLMIDGLGYQFLGRYGAGGALHAHLRGSLTSVFPTTTAAAVTTFATGLAPQQHGITGWFMLLRELGLVTAILPFRTRGLNLALPAEALDRILEEQSFYDRIAAESFVVSHERIADSAFSRASTRGARRVAYRTLKQFFEAVAQLARGGRERRYIYAYWSELDTFAHQHGVGSARVRAHFAELDRGFARLLEELAGTGTLLLATADHGLIDTAPDRVLDLAAHPALAEALALPLCGDPRAAYCYIRPSAAVDFEAYVREALEGYCTLWRGADLIQAGWYGLGEAHPRLAERVGDYVLLMEGNYVVTDRLPGEKPFQQIGVHGGLSEAERSVPLLVARP